VIVCLFTGPRVVWKDAVQNKFFDALAAGKPTASNFEGFQSIVARDADIGIIMDPNSPHDGAANLRDALVAVEWRKEASDRARALAATHFSREGLAIRLGELLMNHCAVESRH